MAGKSRSPASPTTHENNTTTAASFVILLVSLYAAMPAASQPSVLLVPARLRAQMRYTTIAAASPVRSSFCATAAGSAVAGTVVSSVRAVVTVVSAFGATTGSLLAGPGSGSSVYIWS